MNQLTNIATNSLSGFVEDLTLVRIPPWWQSPWFIVLVLVTLAAVVFGSLRLYARVHRGGPTPVQAKPVAGEPPHLWALRELEALKTRQGELGPYRFAIECSGVLRRYIEARFKLPILYQTTREFLGFAQTHTALNDAERGDLGRYLGLCDLVKFAQRGASTEEMTQLVDYAIAFVKRCAGAERSAPGGNQQADLKAPVVIPGGRREGIEN
jgi:hypothetical protein